MDCLAFPLCLIDNHISTTTHDSMCAPFFNQDIFFSFKVPFCQCFKQTQTHHDKDIEMFFLCYNSLRTKICVLHGRLHAYHNAKTCSPSNNCFVFLPFVFWKQLFRTIHSLQELEHFGQNCLFQKRIEREAEACRVADWAFPTVP